MKEEPMNRLRLGDEDGIALVIAVLVMAVLTISVVSLVQYTSASSRDATSKRSGQNAYAYAEAGLNLALSQIASHYYDASGNPSNNTVAGSSAWTTSGSQQAPSSAVTCSSTTTCVTWSTTWTASSTGLGITKGTWWITATGRVPNPTGAGTSISRVATAKLNVTAPPEQVQTPAYWNMIYSGQGPTSDCDMTLGQGVNFKNPVYIQGNLCLGQQGAVEAPATLVVGGWFDKGGGQGHLGLKPGTGSGPLDQLTIAGSCDGSRSLTTACGLSSKKVSGEWVETNDKPGKPGTIWVKQGQFANALTRMSDPAVDFPARYKESYGGSCTSNPTQTPQPALDGSTKADLYAADSDAGTFNLAPWYSYTCTTPSGSLAWNASTGRLTISGTVYIDGNVVTNSNATVLYSGTAALYATGTTTFGNNTVICSTGFSGSGCDTSATWDPNANLLLIVSGSDVNGQNLRGFQGGLYSKTKIDVGGGQTNVQGPMVTPGQIVPGQQAGSQFSISLIISGAPGAPPPHYVLSNTFDNG
jgi:Tfp pilus assembly protein PilX